jgi:acetyl-CoA carboxylase carboxyl transferase subunit beta
VHRHDLRPTLARLCRILTKSPAMEAVPPKPAPSIDIPPPAQIPSVTDVTPVAPHA